MTKDRRGSLLYNTTPKMPHCDCGARATFGWRAAVLRVPLPLIWLLLTLPLRPAIQTATISPTDFATCEDCVGAGYGWSARKGRCGGFANKQCAETAASPSSADQVGQAVPCLIRGPTARILVQ